MKTLTLATLLTLALPAAARAQAIRARETAHVETAGHWSAGVFNPLQIALNDTLTLETHPLLNALGALNMKLRKTLVQGEGWVLAAEGGLGSPTLAFRLSQQIPLASPFFPKWTKSDREVGWMLVPSTGLVWSHGGLREGVLTLRADAELGVPLGPNAAIPVDSLFAPLELVMSPALTGMHLRAGGGYDYPVLDWLRLRAQLFGHLTGPHPYGYAQLSPLFVEGYAGVDIGIGDKARITLGAKWYNWDQAATEVVVDDQGRAQRQGVRSNDFWPTLDFIWTN